MAFGNIEEYIFIIISSNRACTKCKTEDRGETVLHLTHTKETNKIQWIKQPYTKLKKIKPQTFNFNYVMTKCVLL